MKTKVKITLKNKDDDLLAFQSFTISPFKVNRHSSGGYNGAIIHDSTDSQGEVIVSLEPAWYPYRITFQDPTSGETSVNFMVVASDTTVDWELLKVGHYNLDPFTPAGTVLRQAIQANVDATNIIKEANKTKEDILNGINSASTATYTNRLSNVNSLLQTLATLVDALVADKSHVLTAIREHAKMQKEFMETHGDMVQIAKDYVIAKSMGAINLNGHYLWFDDNDKLRWKRGAPIDEFDGTAIN